MNKNLKRKILVSLLGLSLGTAIFTVGFSLSILLATLAFKATAAVAIGALIGFSGPLALGIALAVGALVLVGSAVLLHIYRKHIEKHPINAGSPEAADLAQLAHSLYTMQGQAFETDKTIKHSYDSHALISTMAGFAAVAGTVGVLAFASFGLLSGAGLIAALAGSVALVLVPVLKIAYESFNSVNKAEPNQQPAAPAATFNGGASPFSPTFSPFSQPTPPAAATAGNWFTLFSPGSRPAAAGASSAPAPASALGSVQPPSIR